MIWDPQTQIDPLDPLLDPILAYFLDKKAEFGVKNRIFLKNVYLYEMTFLGSSDHFS